MIFFKATSDISFSENYLIACNFQDVFLQENNNINTNAPAQDLLLAPKIMSFPWYSDH